MLDIKRYYQNLELNGQNMQHNRGIYFTNFIRGGTVGIATVIVGYPFDTVKVRMQNRYFYSMVTSFSETYKKQGINGFYRGCQAPLCVLIIKRGYQYPLFEETRNQLINNTGYFKAINQYSAGYLAGSVAGLSGTIFSCPMHNVKIKMQNQIKPIIETNFRNTIKNIYQVRGIKGFYLGFKMTLLRDFFYSGSYLGNYGLMRQHAEEHDFNNRFLNGIKLGICGAISSIITWSIFLPIDAVKTNIQSEKKTLVLRNRIAKEGIRTLWVGYLPVIIRTIPTSIAAMFLYETLR